MYLILQKTSRGGGLQLLNNPLWLQAKDNAYYSDEAENFLKNHIKFNHFVKFPNINDVQQYLQKTTSVLFIAPYEAPREFKEFLTTKKLRNFNGILTTQDIKNGITKAEAIQERLGISVIDSPFTLNDIGGADKLKTYAKQLQEAEKQGYKSKGIFLVGIPGTGKTFFPTCLAGELKRPLIVLNLEALKETGQAINKLNEVFEFLNAQGEKVILLIDEIEKMVGNADDPLTGRLMTILSGIGDKGSEYKNLNVIVFATANNLESILENQPALIRRGRFDELFFVNLPDLDNAKKIFEMYIKKYKLETMSMLFSVEEIIAEIEREYNKYNMQPNRFCYTPSEIQSYIKKLKFLMISNQEITKQDILHNIKLFIPIIKTSQKGINKIVAQKELFVEI